MDEEERAWAKETGQKKVKAEDKKRVAEEGCSRSGSLMGLRTR